MNPFADFPVTTMRHSESDVEPDRILEENTPDGPAAVVSTMASIEVGAEANPWLLALPEGVDCNEKTLLWKRYAAEKETPLRIPVDTYNHADERVRLVKIERSSGTR